jgi:integrase
MTLTQKSISAIKKLAGDKSDHVEWDDRLPGFGLRLRDGKLTWILQYNFNNKNYRIKLGEHPPLTCEQARELALQAKAQVSQAAHGLGMHPAAKRDAEREKAQREAPIARHTLSSKIDVYLKRRESALRSSTLRQQQLQLNTHWKPLHDLALDKITRKDVANVLSDLETRGPAATNRARSVLSKFFSWAIGEGLCDHNPVTGTNKREENKERERALSDAEVAAVWLGAPNNDYGRILKLILLTGCRRDEIGSLGWSEIDMGARTITLPGDRTKNGEKHVIPLSDAAVAILADIKRQGDREWVFGRRQNVPFRDWSQQKRLLDEAVKLDPWIVHDLRRTVRTGLGGLGVAPHIAEAVINHVQPKLVRIYDRNRYEAEKRDALDRWATHIQTVVAQATGANVTPIRKKGRSE